MSPNVPAWRRPAILIGFVDRAVLPERQVGEFLRHVLVDKSEEPYGEAKFSKKATGNTRELAPA